MFGFLTLLALAVLLTAIGWMIFCIVRHKGKNGFYRPINILSIGVMLTGAVLYIAYYTLLKNTSVESGVAVGFLEGFFTVIHDVYQLFSADSDYTGVFGKIHEALGGVSGVLGSSERFFFALYRFTYVLLYAIAPILTLGVIVSVFKDFVAKRVYHFHYFSDVYIFSELNERSLALATDIVKGSAAEREAEYQKGLATLNEDFDIRMARAIKDVEKEYYAAKNAEIEAAEREGRAFDQTKVALPYTRKVHRAYFAHHAKRVKVIFLGVEEYNDEETHLAEQARQLGGIVFRSGLLTTRFGFHSKNSNMTFFLIGENEAENVDTAIGLLAQYATRDNTQVYVFSDSPESELLLKSAGDESRKKAERLELERMSAKERAALEARKAAEAADEEAKQAAQMAAIRNDPENFALYVTEAPSDYRSGALVRRVNVIRSLIYHTLYHFRFISDYDEERAAYAAKVKEERTAELESTMKRFLEGCSEEDQAAAMKKLSQVQKEEFLNLRRRWDAEDSAYRQKIEEENGKIRNIFERAATSPEGDKVISAVVIGMGLHGTEMLKALAWYGQMEGYRLYVNAFDRDKGAKSRFIAKCPELMSPKYNGPQAEGQEDCYRIDIHAVDIDSQEFIDILETLPQITYVAVCLGDDEKNLEIAVKMRSLCKKFGAFPFIQAIRYNLGENEDFSQAKNFKGQAYDIDLIGDMKSIYSVNAILQSSLEYLALSRHMKWGGERSFWEFEYNHNSSIASALHHDTKIRLGLPGAHLPPNERNDADRDMLRRLEHRRWNAYMRSEGYVFGKRDDLAKTHHCLVLFDELSEYEQNKDDD